MRDPILPTTVNSPPRIYGSHVFDDPLAVEKGVNFVEITLNDLAEVFHFFAKFPLGVLGGNAIPAADDCLGKIL